MTFLQYKNLLSRRLHDPNNTDFKTRCGEFGNEIMHDIVSRSDAWPFLESTAMLALVSGTNAYTLTSAASDIGTIFDVTGLDPDRKLEPKELRDLTQSRQDFAERTGPPDIYVVWNDQIIVQPEPSENEILTVYYYRTVSDLVGDGESPPWPQRFDKVWLLGGMAMGLEYKDDRRSDRYFDRYERAVDNMMGNVGVEVDHSIEAAMFSGRRRLTLSDVGYDPHRYGWD